MSWCIRGIREFGVATLMETLPFIPTHFCNKSWAKILLVKKDLIRKTWSERRVCFCWDIHLFTYQVKRFFHMTTMALSNSQKSRFFSLYRNIHRTSSRFGSTNFHQYFARCARDDFRQFLASPIEPFEQFYSKMEQHLEMLRRQTDVSRLYSEPMVSVLRWFLFSLNP